MIGDRIYFKGGPWPEGHEVMSFEITLEVEDTNVFYHFRLVTENYDSDKSIEESVDLKNDWSSPAAWLKSENCTISSLDWHRGGFRVSSIFDYDIDRITNSEFEIDEYPEMIEDYEDFAFFIRLLGHDNIGCHKIKFEATDTIGVVNIKWSGRIALASTGGQKFNHEFSTVINEVKLPTLDEGIHLKVEEPLNQPVIQKPKKGKKAGVFFLILFCFIIVVYYSEPYHNPIDIYTPIEKGDLVEVERILNIRPEILNSNQLLKGTPLHEAAEEGKIEIAKLLIERGAKLELRTDEGLTPLMEASAMGHYEMVKFLINSGSDINLQDNFGWSAIHFALINDYQRVFYLLLQNKPNFHMKDHNQMTLKDFIFSDNFKEYHYLAEKFIK